MNRHAPDSVPLIVNADDFGYFACVSQGIAECARLGTITATGIIANGPNFNTLKTLLYDLPHIDLGVHLNLTYGAPLTKTCQNYLARCGCFFRNKIETAALIMRRALPLGVIKAECRAQIERCLESDLQIIFLNSHEHVHLMPRLSAMTEELAKEYGIRHLRQPRPEWKRGLVTFSGIFRNLMMHLALALGGGSRHKPMIQMIGNAVSGKLTLAYLRKRLTGLAPSMAYELMCHPGFFDPDEIEDIRLRKLHTWEQEMALLNGQAFQSLLRQKRVRLSRYRQLPPGVVTDALSDQGDNGGAYRRPTPYFNEQ